MIGRGSGPLRPVTELRTELGAVLADTGTPRRDDAAAPPAPAHAWLEGLMEPGREGVALTRAAVAAPVAGVVLQTTPEDSFVAVFAGTQPVPRLNLGRLAAVD